MRNFKLFQGQENGRRPQFSAQNYLSLVFAAIVLLASAGILTAQPQVHDPSAIIKNTDGRYWVFKTGNNVECISSATSNFADWRAETAVFANGYPTWVNNAVPNFDGFFWAPEVIYMNGYYYLYYSASQWGTTKSAIGVARTAKLGTGWTDLGVVIASGGGSTEINAIDAALIKDSDGRVWMSYGSFFGGIGMVEINPSTGKTIGSVTKVAGGNNQDVEASYISKNGGYYYLFINRGKCCKGLNSTYYIQVGRATSITGPYSGWRNFLTSEGRYHGPGHVGLGEGKFTYHFYDTETNGNARLAISTMSYSNGWPVAGTPQNWSVEAGEYMADGVYKLVSVNSNKPIEVAYNNPVDGQNVQQWTDNGVKGQFWHISNQGNNWYKISPLDNASEAMEVSAGSTDNNANISLWNYWGGDAQMWKFEIAQSGAYNVIARNSRICLDVVGRSTADGANIIQYTCNSGSTNQMFRLVPASYNEIVSGTYALTPSHSNKTLDIYGLDAIQYDYLGTANQQFAIAPVDGIWHSIKPLSDTSKGLDVANASTANGANIGVWGYSGNTCQQFRFEATGKGSWRIIARNSGKCLDVLNASPDNGATVIQWDRIEGALNQAFYLNSLKSTTDIKPVMETSVYPNPACEFITLSLPSEAGGVLSAEIYDQLGQSLLQFDNLNPANNTLDIQQLKAGMYVLKVKVDGQVISKLFAKQ